MFHVSLPYNRLGTTTSSKESDLAFLSHLSSFKIFLGVPHIDLYLCILLFVVPYKGWEMHTKCYLGGLGMDVWIILKWILEK